MIRIEYIKPQYNPMVTIQPKGHYKDHMTGLEYSQIAGGIGWPTMTEPGWIVVLGEDRSGMVDGKRPIRILQEASTDEAYELLQYAVDYRKSLSCQTFFAATKNPSMIEILYRFNSDTGSKLMLSNGAFSDDPNGINYALQLIKERTDKAAKTLYFGKSSKIPDLLRGVIKTDTPRKLDDLPWLAALSFAVSSFETYKPIMDYEYEHFRQQALDEYAAEEW